MQPTLFDLIGYCGKTSRVPLDQETREGQTFQPCSGNFPALSNQMLPMFLSLRKDGATQEYYWSVAGGALLGELQMRNTGERPSETAVQEMCSKWGPHSVAEESRLSQILEDTPRRKYCLSPLAAKGILSRSQNRGKDMPNVLRTALETQANRS